MSTLFNTREPLSNLGFGTDYERDDSDTSQRLPSPAVPQSKKRQGGSGANFPGRIAISIAPPDLQLPIGGTLLLLHVFLHRPDKSFARSAHQAFFKTSTPLPTPKAHPSGATSALRTIVDAEALNACSEA